MSRRGTDGQTPDQPFGHALREGVLPMNHSSEIAIGASEADLALVFGKSRVLNVFRTAERSIGKAVRAERQL